MNIIDLKEYITEDKLSDDLLVFICADDNAKFLADQYIAEISQRKNLALNAIQSLSSYSSNVAGFMLDPDTTLSVLRVEKFEELYKGYYNFKNVVVICDKIDKKVEAVVSDFVIKFPKVEDWQMEAFIKTQIQGLTDEDIKWLVGACKNNMYKVQTELDKLKLFKPEEQRDVLIAMKEAENSDLFNMQVFELSDAVVRKKLFIVLDFLKHKQSCDFDVFPIISLVLKKLKNVLFTFYAKGAGLTPKEFNATKYYDKDIKYSQEYLMNKIEFLSDIDNKLKTGALDISKDALLDYVLCGCLI